LQSTHLDHLPGQQVGDMSCCVPGGGGGGGGRGGPSGRRVTNLLVAAEKVCQGLPVLMWVAPHGAAAPPGSSAGRQ
jgi:hypothetical protein